MLHTLLERNLVAIKGRSKGVGRPLLYSTTQEFLSYMGINDLSDLPELKEVAPLLEERERLAEEGEAAPAGAGAPEAGVPKAGVPGVEPAGSEVEVTAADGAT